MTTRDDLLALGSAMVHEASGRRGAIGVSVSQRWAGAQMCGPAYTVATSAGDNLASHIALERCAPGDVLCVATPAGGSSFGAWGEVLARYAIAQGVAGLLTTTGVRDIEQIASLKFPVFAASSSIQGTVKRDEGTHQVPVVVGAVVVRPGDWIVADADGVAVVRPEELDRCIDAARAKVAGEETAFKAIVQGASTRQALGF